MQTNAGENPSPAIAVSVGNWNDQLIPTNIHIAIPETVHWTHHKSSFNSRAVTGL